MTWLVIAFALVGAPMFAVFGALAMISYRSSGMDFSIVIGELTRLTNMPMLQALPMFGIEALYVAQRSLEERGLQDQPSSLAVERLDDAGLSALINRYDQVITL